LFNFSASKKSIEWNLLLALFFEWYQNFWIAYPGFGKQTTLDAVLNQSFFYL